MPWLCRLLEQCLQSLSSLPRPNGHCFARRQLVCLLLPPLVTVLYRAGNDSGGECGVTTARRFVMPGASLTDGAGSDGAVNHESVNPAFWYSFDYGSVHFVMLSTEHDITPGSHQFRVSTQGSGGLLLPTEHDIMSGSHHCVSSTWPPSPGAVAVAAVAAAAPIVPKCWLYSHSILTTRLVCTLHSVSAMNSNAHSACHFVIGCKLPVSANKPACIAPRDLDQAASLDIPTN